jgi:hypothetical protein
MRARPSIVAVAIGTVIAALAVGGDGVHAEAASTDNGFAKRLFAGDPGKQAKSYACFVRVYDTAHLARHPLQKVSVMKLLITAEKAAGDEVLNYSFRLGLAFRNRPGNFDSSGDCGHVKETSPPDNKAQLGCSVDCEGGGISVELAGDSKSTKIRLDTIRIWRNNKPDEDGFSLSGGADDRVFRLDRAGLEQCRSLVTDRKELAAMRRK